MGRCRRADAQMRQSTAHYGPTMGSDYFLRQYNNENRAEPRDLAAATVSRLSRDAAAHNAKSDDGRVVPWRAGGRVGPRGQGVRRGG